MKIKFIGRGSYYASPYHFTERDREKEVNKKLGEHLLKSGQFEEIKSAKKKTKTKTQKEVEEKASKEKEKFEEAKKASKKKSTKKK